MLPKNTDNLKVTVEGGATTYSIEVVYQDENICISTPLAFMDPPVVSVLLLKNGVQMSFPIKEFVKLVDSIAKFRGSDDMTAIRQMQNMTITNRLI